MSDLDSSYHYCDHVARTRAKNFYYSFLLLPKPKRMAMCAVYAFMRQCDDITDEPGVTSASARNTLFNWRRQLDEALEGKTGSHPIWPAFRDTIVRYQIPPRYLQEMIDGVGSDLDPDPIETFDDLYRYCYLVAGVVGLTIIHIFQFHDPQAPILAEKCGVAFQITNILRDVKEDAERGRIYLPGEDLAKFRVATSHLSAGNASENLQSLLADLGNRARIYYDESRPLIHMIHKDSRRSLWALMEIYHRLLKRIQERSYEVLASRIRLTTGEKLAVLAQAWLPGRY